MHVDVYVYTYVYVYVYACMSMCMCVYVYIYIYREREVLFLSTFIDLRTRLCVTHCYEKVSGVSSVKCLRVYTFMYTHICRAAMCSDCGEKE